MPVTVANIMDWLEAQAPRELAEDWDNVGLLLGDRSAPLTKVLTCLTLTPDVAAEAQQAGAELVVTHHPLFFKPVRRITADDAQGRMVLDLLRAGIAVYSAHTAYDSAKAGINQMWAEQLDLREIAPLRPHSREPADVGGGRYGRLAVPQTAAQLIDRIKSLCEVPVVQWTGAPDQRVERMAVACGSAGEFLEDAAAQGCQLFLTGEARFHTQLEARTLGVCLVLVGHYASERPGIERLARQISTQFPNLHVWASREERDPAQWS